MSTFLTPVTLWKDFDDTLPLNVETLSERREEGAVCRELYFSGRQAGEGRVKIYAQYFLPAGEERFPAVLVLFEAGSPFDAAFVRRFTARGYGVLCVDYCGENGMSAHTVYPEAVGYANFRRAGELCRAEPSARETCWYEWAAVARYAAKFLASRGEITRFGAIGLRTGGEVLFKAAPYAQFSCMISVCAAGWLAYRGMEKFAEGEKKVFDEEHHRFIAGLDSQSYAPYVTCPVLLLSAVNDKKHDYDRVYDTFRLLPPAIDKAFLYSAHGNGLIGKHSLADVDLFLDKYLKERSVFVSGPIGLTVEEDGEGNLVARVKFDEEGELHECGIFYTERITGSHARDWTRVLGNPSAVRDGVGVFPLSLYEKSDRALVYAFANYTNNFSVTSKIREVVVEKPYKNACIGSRIVYSSERDGLNGVSGFRRRARSVADCFADGNGVDARLEAGYGGILGATAEAGLVSYRVNEPRYAAPEGVSLRLDAYCKEDALLKIVFYFDDDEENGYSAEVRVAGGGKWKGIFLDASDFKTATGAHMERFAGALSLVFVSSAEVLVNNIVWI